MILVNVYNFLMYYLKGICMLMFEIVNNYKKKKNTHGQRVENCENVGLYIFRYDLCRCGVYEIPFRRKSYTIKPRYIVFGGTQHIVL